jgi:hypothetical protein
MLDSDFKERVLAEIKCSESFRVDVKSDLAAINMWIAAEKAIKAYKKEQLKNIYAVLGVFVAIGGLAATFLLR